MQCSTCIKQIASIRWCCIAIALGWVEYLCFYCTVCSVVWQTRRLPGWQKYYLEFWACMEIRIQREKSVPVEREDEEEIQQCNSEFTELYILGGQQWCILLPLNLLLLLPLLLLLLFHLPLSPFPSPLPHFFLIKNVLSFFTDNMNSDRKYTQVQSQNTVLMLCVWEFWGFQMSI